MSGSTRHGRPRERSPSCLKSVSAPIAGRNWNPGSVRRNPAGGEILVCNSAECPFFRSSNKDIVNKDEDNSLGCRYAEDPDNGYKSFNLLAWYKF